MDTGASSTAAVTSANLVPNYLKSWPVGPVGTGTDYVPGAMDADPTFRGRTARQFSDAATKAASITAAGL
jgi:hypothetical protein